MTRAQHADTYYTGSAARSSFSLAALVLLLNCFTCEQLCSGGLKLLTFYIKRKEKTSGKSYRARITKNLEGKKV